MGGPKVCHTEESKSEREKQILYINAFMWNLEKFVDESVYRAETENRHVNTEGVGGMRWTGRLGLA